MAYLLDGAIILVFLLAIWIGYKRGFIKTMAGLIAFIVAAVVAMLLSGPIAQAIYDSSVEPTVVSTISSHLEVSDSLEAGVDSALEKLPGFVTNALANSGIASGADVMSKLTGVEEDIPLAQKVADHVVQPIVVPLLKVICTLLLFIVVYVVASIVLKVLDLVAKLPILKELNQGLGVLAGAVSGILWVFFLVSVLQVLGAAGAVDGVINQAVINDTVVTNWLIGINPASSMLQEVMTLVEG
ncbi:MAG: CvpA family protein [Clostridia bacterium]|nr:CvpA family protein [Clostridia bacterium]